MKTLLSSFAIIVFFCLIALGIPAHAVSVITPANGTGLVSGSGGNGTYLSGMFDAQPATVPAAGTTTSTYNSGYDPSAGGSLPNEYYIDFGTNYSLNTLSQVMVEIQANAGTSTCSWSYWWAATPDTSMNTGAGDAPQVDLGLFNVPLAEAGQGTGNWYQTWTGTPFTLPHRYLILKWASGICSNGPQEVVFGGTIAPTVFTPMALGYVSGGGGNSGNAGYLLGMFDAQPATVPTVGTTTATYSTNYQVYGTVPPTQTYYLDFGTNYASLTLTQVMVEIQANAGTSTCAWSYWWAGTRDAVINTAAGDVPMGADLALFTTTPAEHGLGTGHWYETWSGALVLPQRFLMMEWLSGLCCNGPYEVVFGVGGSAAGSPTPTISGSPVTGVVSNPYSWTFSSSGTPAPTFSVTAGTLPAGLTLGTSTGTISGTPSTAGTTSGITVKATNIHGSATDTFSMTINSSGIAPQIYGTPPATGIVGTAYGPYSFTVTGTPPPTVSVSAGALPPGLTLSSAGVLSGTPTATGIFNGITFTATNTAGNASDANNVITTCAAYSAAIACGSSTSYTAANGTVYSADAHFSGGTAGSTSEAIDSTPDPTLYQNYRSGACTYSIPLTNGNYVVSLEYCETNTANVIGSREFNVAIEGTTVLTNFDILNTPYSGDEGSINVATPIWETFNTTVTGSTLTIAQSAGAAGTPIISAIFVRPVPTTPTTIAVGEYDTFFLVNGIINALGSNRAGEAGVDLNLAATTFPATAIQSSGVTWAGVAAGGYGTVAVDTSGNVWTWGDDQYGQMANGVTSTNSYLPTQVLTDVNGSAFTGIKQVDAGFIFDAALKTDGSVWVWGESGNVSAGGYDCTGIVGDSSGSITEQLVRPHKVVFPSGTTIASIAAGQNMMMALDTSGNVWTWGAGAVYWDRGWDSSGTGDPATATKLTFGSGETITAIAGGHDTFYAIDSTKNLWGWGYAGANLTLGNGVEIYWPTALPILLNSSTPNGNFTTGSLPGHVAGIKVSLLATHLIRDDGTLWCWGSNGRGEVGNGVDNYWPTYSTPYAWDWGDYEVMQQTPVQVLSNVSKVYASNSASTVYAVQTNGSIWSWSYNKMGTLGNGTLPLEGPNGNESGDVPDQWDTAKPAQVAPY